MKNEQRKLYQQLEDINDCIEIAKYNVQQAIILKQEKEYKEQLMIQQLLKIQVQDLMHHVGVDDFTAKKILHHINMGDIHLITSTLQKG